MSEIVFIIAFIVLTDGAILFCKYFFDRPNPLDKELQPDLIIRVDYWDSMALPLIFVFPFVWMLAWTQERAALQFLPFVATPFLTILVLLLMLRRRLKRYYLTNKGIVILNLLTKRTTTIPLSIIRRYSYRKGYRSSPIYAVITDGSQFNFSTRQIKNVFAFRAYFTKHKIPFYRYDLLTGNDYKATTQNDEINQ